MSRRAGPLGILGIVNVTRDSFSDGGRYDTFERALEHARELHEGGATMIDLGAESSHPDAEDVTAGEECERLLPLVEALRRDGIPVSVDTYKPDVMRAVIAAGAEVINDITALREPGAVDAVRDTDARVIVMHSTSATARASRDLGSSDVTLDDVIRFLEHRVAELERQGISRHRLVLDPGMGFFLGTSLAPSLAVLRGLPRLRELGLPLCISTSRKSFIGSLLGRPVDERGPATLATELYAWRAGADWVRTHDAKALADAVAMWEAIEGAD